MCSFRHSFHTPSGALRCYCMVDIFLFFFSNNCTHSHACGHSKYFINVFKSLFLHLCETAVNVNIKSGQRINFNKNMHNFRKMQKRATSNISVGTVQAMKTADKHSKRSNEMTYKKINDQNDNMVETKKIIYARNKIVLGEFQLKRKKDFSFAVRTLLRKALKKIMSYLKLNFH